MQSLAKNSLSVELTKEEKRETRKALNVIKSSADYDIGEFVLHYPALASINPTRIEGPDATSAKNRLPHVTTYAHEDDLTNFLQGESHVLSETIPKETASP